MRGLLDDDTLLDVDTTTVGGTITSLDYRRYRPLPDDDDEVGVKPPEITVTRGFPKDIEYPEFLLVYGSFTTLEEG